MKNVWITIALASLVTGAGMAMDVTEEHLGDGVFAQSAVWHEGVLHMTTVENMRFGHGQGENFTYWQRTDGQSEWIRQPLFCDHNPSMTSTLPLDDDSTLFLYVDRKDERNRRVYLVRVDGEQQVTLFEYGDDGSGVLNPQMDRLPDGQLHLLIPDRTATHIRRFLVDARNGQSRRLPDVPMPRAGARIYDRLVTDKHLIVPASVINEMLLLIIDLEDHGHTSHSVDRFTSASNEAPRMTSIFPLPDSEHLALVYLRPASFSDRTGRRGPATGLVGEIVVNVVNDQTFSSERTTVIAGLKAEAAATHNMAAVQVGPRGVLLAHTEVDRIHQRHLTGDYENYVGGFLTLWHIDAQGRPVRRAEQQLPPFFSTRLVRQGEDRAVLICNEGRPGDPLRLYRVELP